MYADPSASLANPGYATTAGVENYGAAVTDLATRPLLILLGIGIILFTVIDSGD